MTRSGDDYVRGLRDGRTVRLDGERVVDVTKHRAFAAGVRTILTVPRSSSTPWRCDTTDRDLAMELHRCRRDLKHGQGDAARRGRCWPGISGGPRGSGPAFRR
jgi:hypothetical protein